MKKQNALAQWVEVSLLLLRNRSFLCCLSHAMEELFPSAMEQAGSAHLGSYTPSFFDQALNHSQSWTIS